MVLGQLPPRKIAPNPKTNPKPNANPNWGTIFSRAIVWLPPNPKTNPDLEPNPNPNQGSIFLGGQLSGYLFVRNTFTDYIRLKLAKN